MKGYKWKASQKDYEDYQSRLKEYLDHVKEEATKPVDESFEEPTSERMKEPEYINITKEEKARLFGNPFNLKKGLRR